MWAIVILISNRQFSLKNKISQHKFSNVIKCSPHKISYNFSVLLPYRIHGVFLSLLRFFHGSIVFEVYRCGVGGYSLDICTRATNYGKWSSTLSSSLLSEYALQVTFSRVSRMLSDVHYIKLLFVLQSFFCKKCDLPFSWHRISYQLDAVQGVKRREAGNVRQKSKVYNLDSDLE